MAAVTISLGRWLTKKAARRTVLTGNWAAQKLSNYLPFLAGLQAGTGIRTLTYHRFGSIPRDPFCVRPEDFETQVRWLSEQNRIVSLDDVVAFIEGKKSLAPGSVLLTVDDGYLSTFEHLMPILQRYQAPAVAFITPANIGTAHAGQPERFMTWKEVAELPKSGIAVGAHGLTHRSLGMLSDDEARTEARQAKAEIEQNTGTGVTSFAYPYGTHGDFTPQTEQVLREAGYKVAFNSMHGPIVPGMDLVSLPRIKVEAGESQWMFQALCEGAMDSWRVIDQNLWRLQRVR